MTRNEDRLHYTKVLLEKDGITMFTYRLFRVFYEKFILVFSWETHLRTSWKLIHKPFLFRSYRKKDRILMQSNMCRII